MEDIKQLVLELIEFVSEMAPKVWLIYYRQACVDGVMLMLAGVVGWTLTVCLFRRSRLLDEDDEIFMLCTAIAVAVLAMLTFSCGLRRILNPPYFAIQLLMGQVK